MWLTLVLGLSQWVYPCMMCSSVRTHVEYWWETARLRCCVHRSGCVHPWLLGHKSDRICEKRAKWRAPLHRIHNVVQRWGTVILCPRKNAINCDCTLHTCTFSDDTYSFSLDPAHTARRWCIVELSHAGGWRTIAKVAHRREHHARTENARHEVPIKVVCCHVPGAIWISTTKRLRMFTHSILA